MPATKQIYMLINPNNASAEMDSAEVAVATQRVVELFEALFNLERRSGPARRAALRLSRDDLAKLFGNPLSRSRRPQAEKPPEPEPATSAAPRCSPTGEVAEKPRDPHANWKWDERGNRISPKLPSAFAYTRQLTQPRRGSHWSD
jgi:hypothetical protein